MKWFSFFFLLNVISAGQFALAKSYSGYIEKIDNETYIRKNQNKAQLRYSNATLENLIKKLDDSDFISLEGKLFKVDGGVLHIPRIPAAPATTTKNQLIVESINYVGLNRLLGTWKDDTGLCYLIYSYTSMKTYFSNNNSSCLIIPFQKKYKENFNNFNYFISPDEDTWNIAISNDSTQYIAELNFIDINSFLINVYDENGKMISTLTLRRQ